MEDIGLKQLAVRVCLKILNSQIERTSLTLSTVSGTATGMLLLCCNIFPQSNDAHIAEGEDFNSFTKSLTLLSPGIRQQCVAIIILEDYLPEEDEYFLLTVEGTQISTTIKIVDDDGIDFAKIILVKISLIWLNCTIELLVQIT